MSALLTVRDLAVDFGVGAGAVRAVKQVGFDLDPGRDGGDCRRKRVRQVGDRAVDPAIAALSKGPPSGRLDPFRRRGADGAPMTRACAIFAATEISMIFQEPMTSLNPLHKIEKQIGESLFLHGP